MRCQASLPAGSRGLNGVPFSRVAWADSGTSSLSLALRPFSSKPWQEKQFSARIGWTSRL